MDPLSAGEAVAGGLLLFVAPGFAVAKAIFPERRVAGPEGVRWAIELVALACVLSVVLTVTVGYLLLTAAPGGFTAAWSDPFLEVVLAAIALVAFVAGWFEGAYARLPPDRRPRPPEPGGEGAWELSQRLDRLQRQRQGLERELRTIPTEGGEVAARLRSRLDRLAEEERALREGREAEYEL